MRICQSKGGRSVACPFRVRGDRGAPKENEERVKMVDIAESEGAEMEDMLSAVDCLYVDGGNTFYLQYHCTR
eukprot:7703070-Pyramimonas_sp.AAC.1